MTLPKTGNRFSGSCSGVAERQRDELRAVTRLHPEQHRMLAVGTCVGETFTNVRRSRYRLAADVENHVADLKAVLRGDAAVGHCGDDNAAATRILVGGRERQPELRHLGIGYIALT